MSEPPPLPSASPPPLPTPPPVSSPSLLALESDIASGGRYVLFPWVVSILILTFRRSSEVIYVPPGGSTAGKSWQYALITMCAGWWGIPWGPIFSLASLYYCAQGGKDVTVDVLSNQIPPDRLRSLMALSPKRKPGLGLWLLRLGLLAIPTLLIGTIIYSVITANKAHSREMARQEALIADPRYRTFSSHWNSVTKENGGRSDEARRISGAIVTKLSPIIDASLMLRSTSEASTLAAWTVKHEEGYLVLIYLPKFTSFSAKAQTTILSEAWRMASDEVAGIDAQKPSQMMIYLSPSTPLSSEAKGLIGTIQPGQYNSSGKPIPQSQLVETAFKFLP